MGCGGGGSGFNSEKSTYCARSTHTGQIGSRCFLSTSGLAFLLFLLSISVSIHLFLSLPISPPSSLPPTSPSFSFRFHTQTVLNRGHASTQGTFGFLSLLCSLLSSNVVVIVIRLVKKYSHTFRIVFLNHSSCFTLFYLKIFSLALPHTLL